MLKTRLSLQLTCLVACVGMTTSRSQGEEGEVEEQVVAAAAGVVVVVVLLSVGLRVWMWLAEAALVQDLLCQEGVRHPAVGGRPKSQWC